MSKNERNEQERQQDLTGPREGKTHEATTPPGKGHTDKESVERGEERLDQAGGGH